MKEAPIKVGDVVVVPLKRGKTGTLTGVGKVVAIQETFVKVWLTNQGSAGESWFGFINEVRRSYDAPNPRTES